MSYTITCYQNFNEHKWKISGEPEEDIDTTEQNESDISQWQTPSDIRARRQKVKLDVIEFFEDCETLPEESEFNDKINFTLERIDSTENRYEKFQNTFEHLIDNILKPQPKTHRSAMTTARAQRKGFSSSASKRINQL